jgi:catechol 2,3-dioxygenase-like lactoylglutathione lyase family enzyme
MTVKSVDVGFVSRDRVLVDFLAAVLELEELAPLVFPQGTVHRLQGPAGWIKVMVPAETPADPPPAAQFTGIAGLRYLTLRVTDLDGVLARATDHGGVVVIPPMDMGPGVRLAVVNDSDGNALEIIEEG